ncbi:MAG: cell division transport system permease protein [Solirubrobacterales bacterium]|jgi:cell division transport system permease protein|nr:cell division transport system permease protein [Solirubrobacterales bacterium]
MSRIFFFIQEGLRAMRRSAAPSIAAVVTIVVTVVLIGVLIPVVQTTQAKSNEVRNQLELKTFLFDDATPQETDQLKAKIEAIPHVASVDYIDKAQALKILQGRLSDPKITDQLNSNPLPASFNIKVDDATNLNSVRSALQPPNASGQATPISPIIDEVVDSRTDSQNITAVTGAIRIVLMVITGLLLLASLGLIANTIRLSIYARRTEVEVMRLVGATNWFIRWPFMVEGLVVGLVGGLIAVAVLLAGKLTIVDPLANDFSLIKAQQTINFVPLAIVLLAAAMVVSAIGSGLTLRRFLRI